MIYWITPASAFLEADLCHVSADTWGVVGFLVTAVFKPFKARTLFPTTLSSVAPGTWCGLDRV